MDRLPARHVHLDFHTSQHVPGVGSKFDRKQFQQALKLGRLNHITLFAKCHHSWAYYPTKVGMRHPTLKRGLDLLGEQISACHEIGVRAPIYITAGWSATDAELHPEWCCHNKDGAIDGMNIPPTDAKPTDPRKNFSWKHLCPSGDYKKLMIDQTVEVCDRYPVDGLFYDICFNMKCYCPRCRAGMKEQGFDAEKVDDVKQYNLGKWMAFMRECNAVIHAKHPNASAFYNGLANIDTDPAIYEYQTHFELEDLPTTWGGYDKFPLRSKYFASRHPEKQTLAMSGKFHTAWGEFGGFKHPDAMKFEAAGMIAWGARVSFGDQMHPSGEMDLATYRGIGIAYDHVKKIEDYGLDATPHSNLGLWLGMSGGGQGETGAGGLPHDEGGANMLMQEQIDFEVVGKWSTDLSKYQTIILTGTRCLDASSAKMLTQYVKAGGSLLVLGESALEPGTDKMLFDVGAKYLGKPTFDIDYLMAGKELSQSLPDAPFLSYSACARFKVGAGATVLAWVREPYFSRTVERYCSHQNTPYVDKNAKHIGAAQKGNVIFMAHALGEMYYAHGARVHRQIFINALRRLYTRPVLTVKMPSSGRVNLLHQPQHNRFVAHLLYASPLQRGRCLVIEDLPEIRDVPLSVRLKQKIKRVRLPLENKTLKPSVKAGVLSVVVPSVTCHQVVVLEY